MEKQLPGRPVQRGEAGGRGLTAVPGPSGVHDVQDIEALVGSVLSCSADAGQEAAPIGHPRRAPKRHNQRSITWSSTLCMLSHVPVRTRLYRRSAALSEAV